MKIVVTGGAGFIGSHVVDSLISVFNSAEFHIIDKITYAANPLYIADRLRSVGGVLHRVDLADAPELAGIVQGADLVVHAAAESHVDNSFKNSLPFTVSNTLGTHSLVDAVTKHSRARFIHISTDEVYGENATGSPFSEEQGFSPSNPYSASKAAAEMFVTSYGRCYGLRYNVVRANNIFGIRQFPEKIIPRTIMRLRAGQPAVLHGDGVSRRSYLHVTDFVGALHAIIKSAKDGETFNVASTDEWKNIDVVRLICGLMGKDFAANHLFVADRPHNDCRYLISSEKLNSIGWRQSKTLAAELPSVVDWYLSCGLFEGAPGV